MDFNCLYRVDISIEFRMASEQQILDLSRLKEFEDNNFKFDGNGRKFSKRVENTVEKGEIARYEQFLLFPHCFQKTCTADMLKSGLVWERVQQRKLKQSSFLFCFNFC